VHEQQEERCGSWLTRGPAGPTVRHGLRGSPAAAAPAVGDAIISVFIRAGLVPSTYLPTTTGRKTGRPRTNPATIVEYDGKRWLVAPYGAVSWVHNVRADSDRRVVLRRGLDQREYTVREVATQEAGPLLKEYVRIATPTRPYFQASLDAPVENFIPEASHHPVFELVPEPSP
jgi:deazaflavin-dependent oxidoreductase (nitroreductase family)